MAHVQLRRLGPESWGNRLRRAREAVGLQFRQVEEILFPHVSKSAVVRLERRQEAPIYRKDRGRAALIVLLCGFELEDFDLSDDDIPPAIDIEVLQSLRRRVPSTKWYSPPVASEAA